MRNGLLILKGIVNDNTEADAAQYLTGGLWTKDKRAFHGGRIEVRARLHGAKGAWPAIWTLPYETDILMAYGRRSGHYGTSEP